MLQTFQFLSDYQTFSLIAIEFLNSFIQNLKEICSKKFSFLLQNMVNQRIVFRPKRMYHGYFLAD